MNFKGFLAKPLSIALNVSRTLGSKMSVGLKLQLVLLTVFLVAVTACVSGIVAVGGERQILQTQLFARARVITEALASSSAKVLAPKPDQHALADLLRETLTDKSVAYALIVSEDSKIVAHSDLSRWGEDYDPPRRAIHDPVLNSTFHIYRSSDGQQFYDFSAPVFSPKKKQLGTVHLGMPVRLVEGSLGKTRRKLLLATFILMVIGSTIAVWVGTLITQPLALLASGAKRIGEGDLGYRIDMERNDEYGLLAQRINTMASKLGETYFRTLQMLINALEAKDIYGRGHTERVTRYSMQIARRMGLQLTELENVRRAAMIHDIGKIGVKEAILNKSTGLTNEEYDHVKSHVNWGAHILKPMRSLSRVVSYLSHHHEHFDGSGYPAGLSTNEIPLGARIIAVADTFDAMTSDRPYRKAMTVREAITELKRCAGTQFDPNVVEAFIQILRSTRAEDFKDIDS